jgi:uncharacterized protein
MDRTETIDRVRQALSGMDLLLEAYVFGSVGRGDNRPSSDVDVAVTIDPDQPVPPYGPVAAVTTHLMAALGRNDIDVVVLNGAPPLLYYRVLRDGVRVWSRDLVATTRREGEASSRYCDYVPQLAKIAAARG